MHKNATVAEWYKTPGKHEIYAKGKKVDLNTYEHSLKIDAEDAARVRHLEHDVPLTAAEEDRGPSQEGLRRTSQSPRHLRRASSEEGPADGSTNRLGKRYRPSPVPANFANAGKPVSIALASGTAMPMANGHSNGNGHNGNGSDHAATKEEAAEAVAAIKVDPGGAICAPREIADSKSLPVSSGGFLLASRSG